MEYAPCQGRHERDRRIHRQEPDAERQEKCIAARKAKRRVNVLLHFDPGFPERRISQGLQQVLRGQRENAEPFLLEQAAQRYVFNHAARYGRMPAHGIIGRPANGEKCALRDSALPSGPGRAKEYRAPRGKAGKQAGRRRGRRAHCRYQRQCIEPLPGHDRRGMLQELRAGSDVRIHEHEPFAAGLPCRMMQRPGLSDPGRGLFRRAESADSRVEARSPDRASEGVVGGCVVRHENLEIARDSAQRR